MSRTTNQVMLLLVSWFPVEPWPLTGKSWGVPYLGVVGGLQHANAVSMAHMTAGGECDLGGLHLPAVIGGSLSSSKCHRVWCGLWHTWHQCNDGHRSLWCPDFRRGVASTTKVVGHSVVTPWTICALTLPGLRRLTDSSGLLLEWLRESNSNTIF